AASRMMWSLSYKKMLPAVFSRLTSHGVPYVAIIVTMFGALPGLLSEQFAPETIFKNLLGIAAFTMVVVWMSICLSQFNFRRQWYKQGRTAKELGFAAPLFPVVPILGFSFCFITCISMVFDPEMLPGFIGCMIFIACCYISYYTLYHKKA
ncbi:MAG: amino acid permease, partial [Acinetobacter sp.]|nr:amino acid permease [Acinetobacter sp.]